MQESQRHFLFYIKILGASYLHVKFHDAEGIFTIYIDHFTFPPNLVSPVTPSGAARSVGQTRSVDQKNMERFTNLLVILAQGPC